MKHFEYDTPTTFEEASQLLKDSKPGDTALMAGGTDLIGVLKGRLLGEEQYPKLVVSLKDIPGTKYVEKDDKQVKIGCMTLLTDVASAEALQTPELKAVAEAAYSVASPIIRNRGTIGGNLCQDVRCWFYRYPDQCGPILDCMRKGGHECFAIRGDNRYHSVFGGMKVSRTPCSNECPANTDIPGYMALVRKGDIEGAARILMQANPIPMMTSRVCNHNCQTQCNRCSTDESVAIHSVERVVGDYIMNHPEKFYAAPEKETGFKIGLIGAGPAGLAAAYYLRKAGHDVTVYEALEEPGGCLMYAIPNYRLPKDYVRKIIKAYEGMGVKFLCNQKMGENVKIGELKDQYDRLFIATGAWKRPVLGFDGEEFTEFGLKFLVDVNKWVHKKERKHVLVVGGGNVAMDVALTSKRLGAESVTLCCLEQRDEMPASEEEIERAIEEGVVINNGWGPLKAIYSGDVISGMELKKCVAVRDETGRFNPTYDENDILKIDADSVLLATGQRVDISFLQDEIELAQQRGLIRAEMDTQLTSDPKVYAGGDVVSGPSLVIKAIASGRRAAEAINVDLGVDNPAKFTETGFIRFDTDCGILRKANNGHDLSLEKRAIDVEDSYSLTEEEGIEEARRCMNCGCYSVNASDISPVMVMLGASLKTSNGRTIPAEDFFCTQLKAYDCLEKGELLTEIDVPVKEGWITGYHKFRLRPSIDFAITSLSWGFKMKDGIIEDCSLVLGAVAPIPYKLPEVEAFLKGKKPSAKLAEEAGELATKGAEGIGHNEYKIDHIKTFVKRCVEALVQ